MPVYMIRAGETDLIKIGWADRDVKKRCALLQCGSPFTLTIIRVIEGPKSLEKQLHRHFKEQRERGEWYRLIPEMMTITCEDIGLHFLSKSVPKRQHLRGRREGLNLQHGIFKACEVAGSIDALARKLGISRQAVSGWGRVPVSRAKAISGITGVPLHELRPDLWDAP